MHFILQFTLFPETIYVSERKKLVQVVPILFVSHPVNQRVNTGIKHGENSTRFVQCTTNPSDAKRREDINSLSWKPTQCQRYRRHGTHA